MKNEDRSLQTKKALASALKKKLESKSISHITVGELIGECQLNRNTFYYHFTDVYDLLKWMLEEETFDVVRQFDLLVDYRDAVCFVMNYVEENQHILNCVLDSMGRDGLSRFFYSDFIDITKHLIDQIAGELHVEVEPSFRDFLSCFYTEGMAAQLTKWIQQKPNAAPGEKEKIQNYLILTIRTSLPQVLKGAAEAQS